MITSEFTKRWDDVNGFTQAEAIEKKSIVDASHDVGNPKSKWNPAEIVFDTNKKRGFKVIIRTKQ